MLQSADCQLKQAQNFCAYLDKHRHRIINYQYHQAEQICSIGSGAVESTVKQIDRRTKISGAQWKEDNVPQVLAQRQSLSQWTNLCLLDKKWDAPKSKQQTEVLELAL